MRTILIITALFFYGIGANAQILSEVNSDYETQDIRKKRSLGISASVGGPALLGPSINYFINPQMNMKITLAPFDIFKGFAIGTNYNFKKTNKNIRWSPYFGLEYANIKKDICISFFGSGKCSPPSDLALWYAPAGVAWMAKGGFTISFEAAIFYAYNSSKSKKEYLGPWLGFNIGYRFRTSKK